MDSRHGFQRFARFGLLAALALALSTPAVRAAGGPKGNSGGAKRPAFSLARTPEERRSLFEAWKKQHQQAPGATAGMSAEAVAGGSIPYVGRASMVINDAGTVLYTKNFLGSNATCDPDIESQTSWVPGTAFAAGTAVRPTAGSTQPNGFRGFNFLATAGTSGGTEPVWPQTLGATVTDNTITWTAIGFAPSDFVGCTPMQLISRASGGTETVIAQEGSTLADGSQVAGWAEFMAMNDSGVAAFRAGLAGYIFNDGNEDEGESGIITAGPGAGAVTRIAATNTTIGGRGVCGFSAMVAINNAGQVVFDTYPTDATAPPRCDENDHGIVRFTPGGTGNQLLVEQGSAIGTPAATVIGFGLDDNTGGLCTFSSCHYDNIDGFINASGHVPVVLNLSDGTQGVFILTGPGAATQVVRLPAGSIGPRVAINDGDQVVYRATTGGVSRLFRFTPPATIVTLLSVGDLLGGSAVSSIDAFADINNLGNVVFSAETGAGDTFGFWDGAAAVVTTAATETLASEMITVNDSNQVAYVTGNEAPEQTDEASEQHQTGGIFTWTKAGGSVKAIQVGDVISADTVTSIYAEHTSFARRQFNQLGCLAAVYMVLDDDPDLDCSEGGVGFCSPAVQKGGLLFLSCAGVCPVVTVAPATLPAGTTGTPYSQQLTASGGQAPYTFTTTVGSPPPGLLLSAGGLLSGTPTTTGTFNFTVTATDANACLGTRAYSVFIGSPTQVTVLLSPSSRTIVVGTNGSLSVTINIAQGTNTIVTLTSGNPGIVTVPPTVTILAGQTSAPFTATGVAVGGPVVVTAALPASFNAPPATSNVNVVDAPAAEVPTLSAWALIAMGFALALTGLFFVKRVVPPGFRIRRARETGPFVYRAGTELDARRRDVSTRHRPSAGREFRRRTDDRRPRDPRRPEGPGPARGLLPRARRLRARADAASGRPSLSRFHVRRGRRRAHAAPSDSDPSRRSEPRGRGRPASPKPSRRSFRRRGGSRPPGPSTAGTSARPGRTGSSASRTGPTRRARGSSRSCSPRRA